MASDSLNKLQGARRRESADGIKSAVFERRKRARSQAIAWGLFALVVMFFLVTVVKLGVNFDHSFF